MRNWHRIVVELNSDEKTSETECKSVSMALCKFWIATSSAECRWEGQWEGGGET